MAEPQIVVFEGITIGPHDTLLISAKRILTMEEGSSLHRILSEQLPDNRVIVFDNTFDLIKLEPADGSEPIKAV